MLDHFNFLRRAYWMHLHTIALFRSRTGMVRACPPLPKLPPTRLAGTGFCRAQAYQIRPGACLTSTAWGVFKPLFVALWVCALERTVGQLSTIRSGLRLRILAVWGAVVKTCRDGKHPGSKEVHQDQCPRLHETWPADLFLSIYPSQRTFASCSEGAPKIVVICFQGKYKIDNKLHTAYIYIYCIYIYVCVYQIMRIIMHQFGSLWLASVVLISPFQTMCNGRWTVAKPGHEGSTTSSNSTWWPSSRHSIRYKGHQETSIDRKSVAILFQNKKQRSRRDRELDRVCNLETVKVQKMFTVLTCLNMCSCSPFFAAGLATSPAKSPPAATREDGMKWEAALSFGMFRGCLPLHPCWRCGFSLGWHLNKSLQDLPPMGTASLCRSQTVGMTRRKVKDPFGLHVAFQMHFNQSDQSTVFCWGLVLWALKRPEWKSS